MQGVLVDALANDLSGAMVLFCLTMVVAPRVLVSLRDAREQVALDNGALEVLNGASQIADPRDVRRRRSGQGRRGESRTDTGKSTLAHSATPLTRPETRKVSVFPGKLRTSV